MLTNEVALKVSIPQISGIILAVATFYFYVSNVRPVGWFDSVVALVLAAIVYYLVVFRVFKGSRDKR